MNNTNHGTVNDTRECDTETTTTTRTIMNTETGSKYALLDQIGRGSFATVYRGKLISPSTNFGLNSNGQQQTIAVKEMSTKALQPKLREALELEITVLRQARHKNIMKLWDVVYCLRTEKVYLILEYCSGGDLSEFIRKRGRVNEAIAKHFMSQLAAGLSAMRLQSLVHRDLKPQNLLLTERSSKATLKIADFGFARYIQPHGGMADTVCGSPLYMAPEILKYRKYDAKADLWSVGAILFEMVVGNVPFTGQNQVQLLHNIERSDARIPTRIAETLTPECVALLRSLLRRDPKERISFDAFFNHPFFIGSSSSSSNNNKNVCAEVAAAMNMMNTTEVIETNQINNNNNNNNNRKMSSGSGRGGEGGRRISNEDGDMQFQMDSMNEISLSSARGGGDNMNILNSSSCTLEQTTTIKEDEEIATPTTSKGIPIKNNNFRQRQKESSLSSSSYKCFGTSPSDVVRNEIALAARDLRGVDHNNHTRGTRQQQQFGKSPNQQRYIARFSPGSPPSMVTSNSLDFEDDDYVLVTSPGTGFVPRPTPRQQLPRLGSSPLSRGTSPQEQQHQHQQHNNNSNNNNNNNNRKTDTNTSSSPTSESSSFKTSMLASSPILSASHLLSRSTTSQQMMKKLSTSPTSQQPFSSRCTAPFTKITSDKDKATLLERAAACLRDASAEHWNAGSRLHALSVGLISLNALNAAHAIMNAACENLKITMNASSSLDLDLDSAGPSSPLDDKVSQMSLTDSADSNKSSSSTIKSNNIKEEYAECAAIRKRIEGAFIKTHARCEKASKGISAHGIDINASLPCGLELTHDRALHLTRSGAVEELVGNYDLATSSYGEAQTLLLFLLMDESGLRERSKGKGSTTTTSDDFKRISAFADAVSRRQIAAKR